ncbi:hypothetical protein A3I48_02855 [Candidatus Daviesbacteria bacterium RIFCSPLOWO2_02_FULL_36_7]|uniref:Uncharacterized protein n=1 Tax=Candidatus Daviesbacteria bacterium RIFCSPLOWO2_02_FULL_36_7 TaxID=1797792 RepID=A0A1F5MG32_9BACT|nr:MAG: hypothetical protein A3I48_02855 [Candidatus Daviesbacteria bacterium RIFCSPLOWO2_02_FULL_36_7]
MLFKAIFRYDGYPMDGNDAVLLVKIEEMIKTHTAQIDSLQEEITKRRDMVNDVFTNDETYQEHDKITKEAARIRSNTRKEIQKRPEVADLVNKLKDLKLEQKELREGLSDYLREYQRLSGSNEIKGEDGQIREIVFVAKLIKKSANFKPR